MNKSKEEQKKIVRQRIEHEEKEWEERLKNAPLRLKQCCYACFDILYLGEYESELKTASMRKSLSLPPISIEDIQEKYKYQQKLFLYSCYNFFSNYFIDEEVCTACAKWLKKSNANVNTYQFFELIKLISYECGTKKENALEFLKKVSIYDVVEKCSALNKNCNLYNLHS